MAKKIDITNSINTIEDGGLNTAAEIRALHNLELDNNYGDIVMEGSGIAATPSQITLGNLADTNIKYGIHIVKQGRIVVMKGFIWNQTTRIISNSQISDFAIEIINPEYFPDGLSTTTLFPIALGTFVELNSSDKKIYINALGAGELRNFNLTYFTQD